MHFYAFRNLDKRQERKIDRSCSRSSSSSTKCLCGNKNWSISSSQYKWWWCCCYIAACQIVKILHSPARAELIASSCEEKQAGGAMAAGHSLPANFREFPTYCRFTETKSFSLLKKGRGIFCGEKNPAPYEVLTK